MKFRRMILLAVACVMVFSVQTALAVPTVTKILVDGTGSVSQSDFDKAREAVVKATVLFYERAQENPGKLSDWLSVSFFGGDNDYDGTIFINCSDLDRMGALGAWVLTKQHPQFGSTAVFTAIGKGYYEISEKQQSLPTNSYLKNIIVITDGQDNSGDAQLKRLVTTSFPNDESMLMVIGVGKEFNPAPFRNVANMVVHIKNFDELLVAIMVALEAIS